MRTWAAPPRPSRRRPCTIFRNHEDDLGGAALNIIYPHPSVSSERYKNVPFETGQKKVVASADPFHFGLKNVGRTLRRHRRVWIYWCDERVGVVSRGVRVGGAVRALSKPCPSPAETLPKPCRALSKPAEVLPKPKSPLPGAGRGGAGRVSGSHTDRHRSGRTGKCPPGSAWNTGTGTGSPFQSSTYSKKKPKNEKNATSEKNEVSLFRCSVDVEGSSLSLSLFRGSGEAV